ncbi:MAG TPA: methylmalonyl-CoA mutase family protein, partial [Gemmatimonadaceae bacterium]|nr:methylmalonyl-CoA mutase family protein [Gemmatimonadaceae bacterium]
GYDEALALPTAEAATLALRTQQIIAHESGIANTVDPLAGSYYVEALTTELESRATDLVAKADALGGSEHAIAAGFFQEEIARSAYEHQLRVESGATTVVGVNRFTDDEPPPPIPAPDFSALEAEQVRSVAKVRAGRESAAATAALGALTDAAAALIGSRQGSGDMMPLLIEAVRARCTVGEIAAALQGEWGAYTPPR